MLGETPLLPLHRSTPEVTVMKTVTAFIGSLWLSTPSAFKIMLLLMGFDLISALCNPTVKFKRRVTTVSLSCLLASMVQIVWHYAKIDIGFDLVSGVCAFYAVGSGIDTIVNFSAAGVPIPPVLLQIMLKAQGVTGKEKEQIEAIAKDSQ